MSLHSVLAESADSMKRMHACMHAYTLTRTHACTCRSPAPANDVRAASYSVPIDVCGKAEVAVTNSGGGQLVGTGYAGSMELSVQEDTPFNFVLQCAFYMSTHVPTCMSAHMPIICLSSPFSHACVRASARCARACTHIRTHTRMNMQVLTPNWAQELYPYHAAAAARQPILGRRPSGHCRAPDHSCSLQASTVRLCLSDL